MKKIFLAIFTFLTLYSCNVSEETENKIIISPQYNEMKLSDYFCSYHAVVLSGIELGSIDNVIDVGDYYIVLAKGKNSDLNLFDKNGCFISSIVDRGKASNEAINIVDISYNKDLELLAVLINYGQNVILYSLSERKVIDVFGMPKSVMIASAIEWLDNERFVLYKDYSYGDADLYKINLYNINKESIESQYLEIDKHIAEYLSFDQSNNLYKKGSSVIFYEAFLDKGYKITPDSVSIYFEYDKGPLSVDNQDLKSHNDLEEFVEYCQDRGLVYAHINNYEYNDKLISKYRIEEQSFVNISDLNTLKSKSYTSIYDDLFMNKKVDLFTYKPIASDENHMFVALSAYDLKKYYPTYNEDEKFKDVDLYNNDLIIWLK